MNKPEWMSTNPCKGCSMSGKSVCWDKCDRDKEPAKKLLEYLIANPNMTSGKAEYVSRWTLEEILKRLEDKHG